jgi:hypothetical protein
VAGTEQREEGAVSGNGNGSGGWPAAAGRAAEQFDDAELGRLVGVGVDGSRSYVGDVHETGVADTLTIVHTDGSQYRCWYPDMDLTTML